MVQQFHTNLNSAHQAKICLAFLIVLPKQAASSLTACCNKSRRFGQEKFPVLAQVPACKWNQIMAQGRKRTVTEMIALITNLLLTCAIKRYCNDGAVFVSFRESSSRLDFN